MFGMPGELDEHPVRDKTALRQLGGTLMVLMG